MPHRGRDAIFVVIIWVLSKKHAPKFWDKNHTTQTNGRVLISVFFCKPKQPFGRWVARFVRLKSHSFQWHGEFIGASSAVNQGFVLVSCRPKTAPPKPTKRTNKKSNGTPLFKVFSMALWKNDFPKDFWMYDLRWWWTNPPTKPTNSPSSEWMSVHPRVRKGRLAAHWTGRKSAGWKSPWRLKTRTRGATPSCYTSKIQGSLY